MPPSEAQKRAANKWARENMATLGCKVRREEAAAFKDYAARRGKTSNTLLKDYVASCINENELAPEINAQRDTRVREGG